MEEPNAPRTPTRSLGEMSGTDASMDMGTSNMSMLRGTSDSLLGTTLLGQDTPAGAQRSDAARGDAAPQDTESEDQVQAQLEDLRRLSAMFSSYEEALAGSISQMDTFSSRVQETHALLDAYVDLLKQSQRRHALLTDPTWQGASQEAAQQAEIAQGRARRPAPTPRSEPPSRRGAATTHPARGAASTASRGVTRGSVRGQRQTPSSRSTGSSSTSAGARAPTAAPTRSQGLAGSVRGLPRR